RVALVILFNVFHCFVVTGFYCRNGSDYRNCSGQQQQYRCDYILDVASAGVSNKKHQRNKRHGNPATTATRRDGNVKPCDCSYGQPYAPPFSAGFLLSAPCFNGTGEAKHPKHQPQVSKLYAPSGAGGAL